MSWNSGCVIHRIINGLIVKRMGYAQTIRRSRRNALVCSCVVDCWIWPRLSPTSLWIFRQYYDLLPEGWWGWWYNLSVFCRFHRLDQYLQHFLCCFSDNCSRAENSGHAFIVQVLVILVGNYAPCDHHDIFSSQFQTFYCKKKKIHLLSYINL